MSEETFKTAQSCTDAVILDERSNGDAISLLCHEVAKGGFKKLVLDVAISEGAKSRLIELGFIVDKTRDGRGHISWQ